MDVQFYKWAQTKGYDPADLGDPETLRGAKEQYRRETQSGGNGQPAQETFKRVSVTICHGSEVLHSFVREGMSKKGRGGLGEAARSQAEAWVVKNGYMDQASELQIGVAELKFLTE